MDSGYTRIAQLLGHVRGKATEPCATAHDAVAVPLGRSAYAHCTGSAFLLVSLLFDESSSRSGIFPCLGKRPGPLWSDFLGYDGLLRRW